MKQLAATFEMDYTRISSFIKVVKDYNVLNPVQVVKYDGNYDDVRGNQLSVMSFIGYLANKGECCLIGIDILE